MARTTESWPLQGEAGMLYWRGNHFSLLVIVQHFDHRALGSRPPQTASWVTVMTNTIEGAGTSLEESAATMTVRGKEMKDVEETIGMTGKTLFLNFVFILILLYFSLRFPYNFIKANHV